MRFWLVIVGGAIAATAANILVFAPAEPWSGDGLAGLFLSGWPTVTVTWLGIYAVAVLSLSTLASLDEGRSPRPPQLGNDWARCYVMRLVVSQYFTAVVALLVIGLVRLSVKTGGSAPLSAAVTTSPGLIACGATVVAGLIGWLIVSATMLSRQPLVPPALGAGLELQLLLEIADLVRGRPPSVPAEFDRLSDLMAQGQRLVLEGLKDVVRSINHLGSGMRKELGLVKNTVAQQSSSFAPEALGTAESGMARAAAEVHAALGLLDASVGRLAEIAAFMAASEAPSADRHDSAARSRLSTELQQLLRELAPGRNDRSG